MKKLLCRVLALALVFALTLFMPCAEDSKAEEAFETAISTVTEVPAPTPVPAEEEREPEYIPDYLHLRAVNPTPLTGRFFTTLWGASTSDLDVQDLLHGYALTVYDGDLGTYRMNDMALTGCVVRDDAEGNRTYTFALRDDLFYSDGSRISAWDYAFAFLFLPDPAIAAAGGVPADLSWLYGMEEYLTGENPVLSGLRVMDDYLFSVKVKAEALPYFYELSRFHVTPFPLRALAPDCAILDEGEGTFLSPRLTGDSVRRYVLDSYTGYMMAPSIVSGPYMLESYMNGEARFRLNPYYQGHLDDETPAIPELTYGLDDGLSTSEKLASGDLGLLNKVTRLDSIRSAMEVLHEHPERFAMTSYPRSGLALIRFQPESRLLQDVGTRKAIFYCLDREAIVREYLGGYGTVVKGLYGVGQWMERLLSGEENYPVHIDEETATEEERLAYEAEIAKWRLLSLDVIPEYILDTGEAKRLLAEDGWNLNLYGEPYDGGVRCRRMEDGVLTRLSLTALVPLNMKETLELCWAPHLEEAGIEISLTAGTVSDLQNAYADMSDSGYDMVFIGEDFNEDLTLNGGYDGFDEEKVLAEIMAEYAAKVSAEGEDADALTQIDMEVLISHDLRALNAYLNGISREMYRRDRSDLYGFEEKWLELQTRIAEYVPVIPVYSNVYFDFYVRELRNYRVEDYLGWGAAIPEAWLGYADEKPEDEVEESSPNEADEAGTFVFGD